MEEISADNWQYTTPLYADESDFIADLDAPEIKFNGFSGQYLISLNTQSFQYGFERIFKQALPFERNFETLNIFINTSDTHNVSAMTLIAGPCLAS